MNMAIFIVRISNGFEICFYYTIKEKYFNTKLKYFIIYCETLLHQSLMTILETLSLEQIMTISVNP